jgi:protein involved in polysaccharide export with SLBB domain
MKFRRMILQPYFHSLRELLPIFARLFCALSLLSACSGAPKLPDSNHELDATTEGFFIASAPTDIEAVNGKTEVRPGFLLRMRSDDDAALNKSVRVDRSGHLKLPYNVEIQAAGLTLEALRLQVENALRAYFRKTPKVQIAIEQRKYWVDVRGLVTHPNSYLVDQYTPIDGLVELAGGLTHENPAQVVAIHRGKKQVVVDLQEYYQGAGIESTPKWQGGESAWFLNATSVDLSHSVSPRIQVLGEVRSPGSTSFREGEDLYYYLARMGGPTAQADMSRIQVIRNTKTGRAFADGSAETITHDIKLSQGDMIIVGSSMPGRTERWLQIGATASAIVSAIGVLILIL